MFLTGSTTPQETLDPEVLIWCEEHRFLLVINDRRSMPTHLAENQTLPRTLALRRNALMGSAIEDLLLIAEIGAGEEFKNRIRYIPL